MEIIENCVPSSSEEKYALSAKPYRGIYSPLDLENFIKSDAYVEITNFVRLCGESIAGLRISDVHEISETVQSLDNFMTQASEWINDFPPIQQPMRFGNKAYRNWYERLNIKIEQFLDTLLTTPQHQLHFYELKAYLSDSFGNDRRIDYGTGHETNLILFFLCLMKLRILSEADLPGVVLRVFVNYIKTMRNLQSTYYLEPAGSHGVWGLDDYHCLIYVWGSFQLIDHLEITPKSVRDQQLVSYYSNEYMYLEGIATIYRVKSTAPFSETSPMLYSVSELRDWRSVKSGMLKLYEGEVLHKLPVVQHIVFGNLIRCTWTPSSTMHLPTPPSSSQPSTTSTSTMFPSPTLPGSSSFHPRSGVQHHGGHVVDEFATAAPWAQRR